VMLEVPSLLFQIEEICRSADFVSVGTNDLMQFLFAVDRENRMVANRFDPLSVPALRALRLVAETAAEHGCSATICGEIAGRPLEALALIGLGFRSLSMAPTAIGPVKAMLLELDVGRISTLLCDELARSGSGETLRPVLAAFAESHGISV
jgi:phosphotransferase system enzyme I (PtsP)